jgi:methionine-rich copper-binding protein CopC
MRRLASVILVALAALAAGAPAFAHALLEQAAPRAGARLAAPPAEVRLTFSEPLEPAFSSFTVSGPPGFGGAPPAKVAGADHRSLAAPLKAPVPAGRYQVSWRAVSTDSHVTQGSFSFEVGR